MGMFDVGDKPDTLRIATARAIVKVSAETVSLIMEGKSPKGDTSKLMFQSKLNR